MRIPRHPTPQGACDSHMHLFDPAFAANAAITPQSNVADYRRAQARLGTTRTVVVQPRPYGIDNSATLAAMAQLGPDNARGVAVIHPDIAERELETLHAGGIRGVRFSLYTPANAAITFGMLEPVARRIQPFGWHVQLHWTADQIHEHAGLLRALTVPMVFDHMARLPPAEPTAHPAFDVVRGLLADGRAWVKLAGAYLCTREPHDAGFRDVLPLARNWVATAPDRLVWGSDWPHVTEQPHPPDAVALLDLLTDWVDGDEELRRRVLVDNPGRLYGFA